ncbi:MAG: hypothetical protein MZU95_06985 [Desulfomicrobium escambiense]|nr:hypothetical protein [Desulfomicrobium escambiense]
MGKTLTEKVLGRKAGKDVQAGEVVTVSPGLRPVPRQLRGHHRASSRSSASGKVKAPEKIVIVLDHIVPAADEKYAQNHKSIREFVAGPGHPELLRHQRRHLPPGPARAGLRPARPV